MCLFHFCPFSVGHPSSATIQVVVITFFKLGSIWFRMHHSIQIHRDIDLIRIFWTVGEGGGGRRRLICFGFCFHCASLFFGHLPAIHSQFGKVKSEMAFVVYYCCSQPKNLFDGSRNFCRMSNKQVITNNWLNKFWTFSAFSAHSDIILGRSPISLSFTTGDYTITTTITIPTSKEKENLLTRHTKNSYNTHHLHTNTHTLDKPNKSIKRSGRER